MHHWPLGAVVAFVTGLAVALALLIFAAIRSWKGPHA